MPKGYTQTKNFARFKASEKLNLILLQAFTFGVYNTRLKLKCDGYKFRQSDIVTVLAVGELNEIGCKVSDFANLFGYQNSVSRNVLNRSASRGLLYKIAGEKGRGRAARYYVNDRGLQVFQVLKKEMGKTFDEAKIHLTQKIIRRLNKPLLA